MKKVSIRIEIFNEGQLEDVRSAARGSGCTFTTQKNFTEAVITGTRDQLQKFYQIYWAE